MKFTARFATPRLDTSTYRTALDSAMREVLSQAVMEWLARVLDEVPVWSGASRATFLKLANTIGTAVPIVPVVPSRIDMGYAASNGKLNINEPPGQYTFTYDSELFHLFINEYYDATQWGFHLKKPGPYHFQAKGQIAFINFAKGVYLPDPWLFLKTKKVKV
jgi:hypothetical protein